MRKEAETGNPPANSKHQESRFSRASVARFSLYLRCVQNLFEAGKQTVSSNQLGKSLGITDTQVRKDLAYLGNLGHRGVGYPTEDLINALRSVLGVNRTWKVVVVGVGNLARALLRYRGFQQQGFHIVALFDNDRDKIGKSIEGLTVYPPEQISDIISSTGAELAMLTVPSEVAQDLADKLVSGGVRGILNFAPVVLRLPNQVKMGSVDLAVQLEQLASLVHLNAKE